ncbi:DUF2637 domain-containing protein [Mycobacterium xenopi]|uniref:DUF2637 domain-containing protein n=1 Tax=Mycobacterium xenopi TaxID=1789 RepID=UPI000A15DD17|nr:DUF2637 domain-containing protein [Mycobacterium xenopi]ORX13081.1 hypothetical protein AWC32_15650 [Mycobacterium xenopi]SPX94944.1 Protein of uncharacterised function (DUF2637) [Mycobacterium xenopi]
MTIIDDAPTHTQPRRNGAQIPTMTAHPAPPSSGMPTAPPSPAGARQNDNPAIDHAPAGAVSAESAADTARRHALWFFWMWLLFATIVSIGGNVIHAWMTAPATHLKLLAAVAAAVPPAVLLGSTHSVALLIKTRRRGYRRVDAVVLAAALVLTVGVAACAFAMSFFSLRDLMILLGMSSHIAWLWPIAVDLSLICSTLALLTLTAPQVRDLEAPDPGAASTLAAAASSGPSSPAERRLWWESIGAVVQQHNSDVRKIAELPSSQIANILERLYDKTDSQRAICADTDLHHREVRTIKHTADQVLARVMQPASQMNI